MFVFRMAMVLELEFESFYTQCAAEVESENLKKIFLQLAADERKHYQAIKEMKRDRGELAMEDSPLLQNAEILFAQLIREKPVLDRPDKVVEAYRYAMGAEADSTRLYLKAMEQETDPEIKNLLKKIAAEEEKHFQLV